MTTASGAFTAVTNRVLASPRIQDAHGNVVPVRWKGDDFGALPDEPEAFVFLKFENHGSGPGPTSYGAGAGNNIYRNHATVLMFVFTPDGEGPTVCSDLAEQFAARLRSFRDADISCFSADVIDVDDDAKPNLPGLTSAVDDYQAAIAEVSMHFDTIG